MANRQYRRRKNGQFAARGDSGTTVTVGRAGGFANASVRAKRANNAAAARRRKALVRKGVKVAVTAGTVGALAAVGQGIGTRGATRAVFSHPGNNVSKIVQANRRRAMITTIK